jgi:hypothetical protein
MPWLPAASWIASSTWIPPRVGPRDDVREAACCTGDLDIIFKDYVKCSTQCSRHNPRGRLSRRPGFPAGIRRRYSKWSKSAGRQAPDSSWQHMPTNGGVVFRRPLPLISRHSIGAAQARCNRLLPQRGVKATGSVRSVSQYTARALPRRLVVRDVTGSEVSSCCNSAPYDARTFANHFLCRDFVAKRM